MSCSASTTSLSINSSSSSNSSSLNMSTTSSAASSPIASQMSLSQIAMDTTPNRNESVSAAAAGQASCENFEEPNAKKTKLTHETDESILKSKSADPVSSKSCDSVKKLEEKIGGILCCTVCLDLPKGAIFQCQNGHLMCDGCHAHLLADSRLKDEDRATCPNCRCDISRNQCNRNLAVENTLRELSQCCVHCNERFPRHFLESHETSLCLERPVQCLYKSIGCSWEGPFHEQDSHCKQCIHPTKPTYETFVFFEQREKKHIEDKNMLSQIIELMGHEKIFYTDLQFKQYKTDDITPKLYYETSRFLAFGNSWVIKGRINDNEKNPNLSLNRYISYQLILKQRVTHPLEIKFFIMRNPYGDVPIQPSLNSFEFNETKSETDYVRMGISSSDCNKLLSSKTINFRVYMFQ